MTRLVTLVALLMCQTAHAEDCQTSFPRRYQAFLSMAEQLKTREAEISRSPSRDPQVLTLDTSEGNQECAVSDQENRGASLVVRFKVSVPTAGQNAAATTVEDRQKLIEQYAQLIAAKTTVRGTLSLLRGGAAPVVVSEPKGVDRALMERMVRAQEQQAEALRELARKR